MPVDCFRLQYQRKLRPTDQSDRMCLQWGCSRNEVIKHYKIIFNLMNLYMSVMLSGFICRTNEIYYRQYSSFCSFTLYPADCWQLSYSIGLLNVRCPVYPMIPTPACIGLHLLARQSFVFKSFCIGQHLNQYLFIRQSNYYRYHYAKSWHHMSCYHM